MILGEMSDFGAGACDFHSDFVSDFRTEGNDYASDFRDFPGDFGGAPRTAKQPPETTETAPPEQAAPHKVTGAQGRRTMGASWQRKRQATKQRTTPRHEAINSGHMASGIAAVWG